MTQRKNCGICHENEHKYRCPGCNILYCSVSCYKEHKESKCEPKVSGNPSPKLTQINTMIPGGGLKFPEFHLTDEETEDKVSKEQLDLLGQSIEMKALLNNPHLRTMMCSLVKSAKPARDLDVAMQEPIFTEFADKCLAIINNQNEDDDDFPEIEDL